MDNEQLSTFSQSMSGQKQFDEAMREINRRIDQTKEDGVYNYMTFEPREVYHDKEHWQKVRETLEARGLFVIMVEPPVAHRIYNFGDDYLRNMRVYWEDVPAQRMDRAAWRASGKAMLDRLLSEIDANLNDAMKYNDPFYEVRGTHLGEDWAIIKHVIDTYRDRGYTVTMAEPDERQLRKSPVPNLRISWENMPSAKRAKLAAMLKK